MVNLGIGMLRIKRLESATDRDDSREMVFALEDVNGFANQLRRFCVAEYGLTAQIHLQS